MPETDRPPRAARPWREGDQPPYKWLSREPDVKPTPGRTAHYRAAAAAIRKELRRLGRRGL